jgi:integrase
MWLKADENRVVLMCRDPGPMVCNLQPKAWYRALSKLCETVGIEWIDNVMRHTFATYHLAAFGDAGKTAKELGHQDGVRLLYRHYAHAGLSKAEAEAYWRISPLQVKAVEMKEKTA